MKLECAGKTLDLSRPQVMGILNVTPDSFSDGGRFDTLQTALDRARKMVDDGAAILDVGGESTRPGARAVTAEQEIDRVLPVIEALVDAVDVPVSIDTNKAQVMRAAVAAGAGMINDVMALGADGALQAAADLAVPVCLMHMQGQPRSMQDAPQYSDVVADIMKYLQQRLDACEAAGISHANLLVDPGFGFGKTLQHNMQLLSRLDAFSALNVPVLAGLSRKSMLGMITGRDVEHRMAASVTAAVIAVQRGAGIVRVHDVAETVDALTVWQAVAEQNYL